MNKTLFVIQNDTSFDLNKCPSDKRSGQIYKQKGKQLHCDQRQRSKCVFVSYISELFLFSGGSCCGVRRVCSTQISGHKCIQFSRVAHEQQSCLGLSPKQRQNWIAYLSLITLNQQVQNIRVIPTQYVLYSFLQRNILAQRRTQKSLIRHKISKINLHISGQQVSNTTIELHQNI